MGRNVADAMKTAMDQSTAYQGRSPDAQLLHLTKLVHILWKEVERLQGIVHVIPEGLQIKTGLSEVLVLRNGGIILQGTRIFLKSASKDQQML